MLGIDLDDWKQESDTKCNEKSKKAPALYKTGGWLSERFCVYWWKQSNTFNGLLHILPAKRVETREIVIKKSSVSIRCVFNKLILMPPHRITDEEEEGRKTLIATLHSFIRIRNVHIVNGVQSILLYGITMCISRIY